MSGRKVTTTLENSTVLERLCPFIYAISRMGSRWKPAILWKIAEGKNRFGALKSAIPPIRESVLARHLRELERDGLITRHDRDEMPLRVEYALTPRGRELKPILARLKQWSERNSAEDFG